MRPRSIVKTNRSLFAKVCVVRGKKCESEAAVFWATNPNTNAMNLSFQFYTLILQLSKLYYSCGEIKLTLTFSKTRMKKKDRQSVQFSSVSKSCLTLCDPTDCSMPSFPVHHKLPELAQIHVHRVGDAIQPSCPLSSHSLPAFNLSQHCGLCQISSSHQVPKVLEFQLQHKSFQ